MNTFTFFPFSFTHTYGMLAAAAGCEVKKNTKLPEKRLLTLIAIYDYVTITCT